MPHVHNALHHFTDVQAAYRRAVGEATGDFSGIERAGETLTPIIDLWSRPEWALLRGEILFSRYVAVAAAPGLFSSVELVNPAASKVLAVVLEISNTGGSLQPNVDSGVALGAVATTRGVANDCRYPQLGAVSQCTVVTGQLAAAAALPQDTINSGVRSTRAYILQPGKKLFLANDTANVAAFVSLFWFERPIFQGEL